MRAPHLNHPLILEAAENVPDGAGGFEETWGSLGTLWAEIRPGASRVRADNAATISEVTCRILVRAAPMGAPSRPRAGQRFRHGQRLWRILTVSEADPAGAYLACVAREEVVA